MTESENKEVEAQEVEQFDFEFHSIPGQDPITGRVPLPVDRLVRVNTSEGSAFARIPHDNPKVVISFFEVPPPPPEPVPPPEGEAEVESKTAKKK